MPAPVFRLFRHRLSVTLVLATAGALLAGALLHAAGAGETAAPAKSPYAAWKHGLPADPAFFPIAVWLQDPANAKRYKAAGINVYVGLWEGPTEKQLAALKAAGMPVICDQNALALKHLDDPTIVAWMHGDEPDNAQEIPGGKGYGPPIAPEKIVADYQKLKTADPSRPIMLNLGQGVAWDGWVGRGPRTNHPEDYAKYIPGSDIVSFDIYPVAHDNRAVQGKLEFVAQGVERLIKWSEGKKVVWNCIECTHISSDRRASPAQVKAEVWMALVSGSQGLIYFVHDFKPRFDEHALLDDPEMLPAVTAINKEIAELAPALNSPTLAPGATVASSAADVPIRAMTKRLGGATYVFAVAMRGGATKAAFTVPGLPPAAEAEVIGEGRSIKVSVGKFDDAFEPYGVHLYRFK
jgi:hypothetical protein